MTGENNEHVRTAQTYVSALQRGVFDPSLNLRLYQTEMNAYMVSWAFARTNDLTLNYNGMTAYRRQELGLPNNDIRMFYKVPNDVRYEGTHLEDIWP